MVVEPSGVRGPPYKLSSELTDLYLDFNGQLQDLQEIVQLKKDNPSREDEANLAS